MSSFYALFLFGLAFVVLPFGTSWHEIPKVVVALLSIALLSILFFWKGESWKKISVTFQTKIALGGLGILSIFGFLTEHTDTTFLGNAFRMQGVFLLWALLLWSIISPILTTHKKRRLFACIAILGTLLIALTGRLDGAGRAVGAVGEANSLGAYTLFVLPLTQTPFALVPAIALIFLSGSRSALIGLVAQGIILIGSKRFRLGWTVAVASLFLTVTLLLPFVDTKQEFDSRATIWQTALQAGMEKPIVGWGVGNTEVGLQHAAQTLHNSVRFQYVDSSHNVFLDWWVQGGIIGLTFFSSVVGMTVIGLVRKKDIVLLASFFGILTVMLFNPVSVSILVPFWWIVGVGNKK
ncbi:MAG: O-antigen ligase family protein [Candidatus Woesebacteria bacterium]